MLPASVDEYFRLPDAQRILLLEITRRDGSNTRYCLSDDNYATEPGDSPAMMTYSPVIGAPGLPDLKRLLQDPFDGSGSTSFGSVTLTATLVALRQDGGLYDLGNGDHWIVNAIGDLYAWAVDVQSIGEIVLRRGAMVTAKIAAPRQYYPYASARVLMRGRVARVSGSSDGETTVEITDLSETFRRAIVPVGSRPLCFGICRNVEPFLVDSANLVYAVHDGPIRGVTAVYDDGVTLTPVTQYTVNPATGEFTLLQSPVGKITADVEGAVVGSIWLRSTQQVSRELMARAGQDPAMVFEGLPAGAIGLYLTESAELGSLLTDLMRGAAAYWIIDKTGVFRAALYPLPGGPGELIGEGELLERATYEDDDRLHSSIRYLYRRNWTKYQSRPAASQQQADFSQREGLEGAATLDAPDAELQYLESDRLNTYFDAQGDAQRAAGRLLALFSVPRKRLRGELPYQEDRELGGGAILSFNGQVYRAVFVGLTDVFDGRYPVQRIEAIA